MGFVSSVARLPRLMFGFLLLAALPSAFASPHPGFEPGREFATAGSLVEPVPLDAFVETALLASGVPVGLVPELAKTAVDDAQRAAAAVAGMNSEYAKAEALLGLLHDSLLRNYVERETRYDILLKTGRFNCVSSSIAYMAYAKAAGLEVAGVTTKDHAFCAVVTERGPIDVETTNRSGFDPGTKKEFQDSFGKVTGFSYVPPKNYSDRTRVGEKETIGLELSNRVADLERAGKWHDAVVLAVDRHALLASEASLAFLADRLANYANALMTARRFTEAFEFLSAAIRKYGNLSRLETSIDIVVRNTLADFSSRRDWDAGFAFAESARASRGDSPHFAEFSRIANHNRMVELLNRADFSRAAAVANAVTDAEERKALVAMLDQAEFSHATLKAGFRAGTEKVLEMYNTGRISSKQVEESFNYLYGKEAERVAKAEGWLKGAAVFDAALRFLPGNPALERSRLAFASNHAIDAHNRFAAAWNAGRREEARAIVEEALRLLPDHPLLKKDLETISGAR